MFLSQNLLCPCSMASEQPICIRMKGWPIIVAGGASGIGAGVVARLHSEGAIVQIFDVNGDGAKEVADRIGPEVTHQVVDVTNKEMCVQAVERFAVANGGVVRGLMNSVAYFGSKSFNAEKEDWDKSFGVNVVGYANMVIACHPYLLEARKKKLTCSIVNVASTSARIGQVNRWTYNATKGAVSSMTRCMALDMGRDGIRVNAISPSWTWTPEVMKAAKEGGRERWEPIWGKFHMLNRIGNVEEVASAIAFLLSDDAGFVTGSDMACDGGYMTIGPERFGEDSKFAGSNY